MPDTASGHRNDEYDRVFLQRTWRPDYELGDAPLRLVDLFSGCGAMTLGVAEAAHRLGNATEVALAMDTDPAATTVYVHNFPKARVREEPVEHVFDGNPRARRLTQSERSAVAETGPVDYLLGGPPCQGHSNLNNHTRRRDPRNHLYVRMARAARVLGSRTVIIENVPPVVRDQHRAADETVTLLAELGYDVAHRALPLYEIGVPQRRRRHVVLALREHPRSAHALLDELTHTRHARTVRWAIADLEDAEGATSFDTASIPSAENRDRIAWLFANQAYDLDNTQRPPCHQDGEHTYRSMYGRLWWDRPAQTITSGFGSMGQGRYVHPTRPRTLTPHEAARLQFLPDFFDLSVVNSRKAWARMIGNAVPPKLTLELARLVIERDPVARHTSHA